MFDTYYNQDEPKLPLLKKMAHFLKKNMERKQLKNTSLVSQVQKTAVLVDASDTISSCSICRTRKSFHFRFMLIGLVGRSHYWTDACSIFEGRVVFVPIENFHRKKVGSDFARLGSYSCTKIICAIM